MRSKRLTWITVFVLAVLVSVTSSYARVPSVTMVIKGMSCPFCAFGLEKKLKKVEGVKSIKITLKTGKTVLSAEDGKSINVSQIPKAVKDAGFTIDSIEITAVGTIIIDDQKEMSLQVDGTSDTYRLTEVKNPVKKRLRSFAKSKTIVEVIGSIQKPGDSITSFTVLRVSEASA
ncbi:MAG TPA: heavy-metal-associated domain-containing protein [Spirochaetes bacterium]|nr:heavy-metal-associated domain-containing protein [Spirochaetota bacterium]